MSTSRQKIIERLTSGVRESGILEFKRGFDPASAEAWCEIVKDIVAMANSGGGAIVFGVEDNGSSCVFDATAILSLDLADVTNRIAKYSSHQFSELEVIEIERSSEKHVALLVGGVDVPIVFTKPGTYDIGGGKQKTAFSQGTIYFRHGAKSEPGNRDDLIKWRDREVERVRHQWMSGIRKVVDAPSDHTITVVPPGAVTATGQGIEARISNDPKAPGFVPLNAEEIWPHRRKNLIDTINRALAGTVRISGHDIQCINKKYDTLKAHPEFAYKPHSMASPQYSQAYADWIVARVQADATFLTTCRAEYRTA